MNDLERLARFEEGVSADPTANMSEEDAAKWKEMNEKHRDKFKTANLDANSTTYVMELMIDKALELQKRRGYFGGPGKSPGNIRDYEWQELLDEAFSLIPHGRFRDRKQLSQEHLEELEAMEQQAKKMHALGIPKVAVLGKTAAGRALVEAYLGTPEFRELKSKFPSWGTSELIDVVLYRNPKLEMIIGNSGAYGNWGKTYAADEIRTYWTKILAMSTNADMFRELFDKWNKKSLTLSRTRRASDLDLQAKVAVNLPADVERYVKEIEKSNPDYDEAKTWATAWSIFCKHKSPGDEHCKRPASEYFMNKSALDTLAVLASADTKERPLEAMKKLAAVPAWPGADAVYSYLYKVLENMGAAEWAKVVAQAKKTGKKIKGFTPTAEMTNIVKALDEGDEEELKGIQMKYKTNDYLDKTKKTATGGRPLYDIAKEIQQDWKRVYFGAVPYLQAMATLDSIDDDYGMDSGKPIVLYFLSNATSWRGEVAKRIKKELGDLAKKSKKYATDLATLAVVAAGEDDAVEARFEEGKPADPTENMSPEDAAEWKKQHDEHKDEFKTALAKLAAMVDDVTKEPDNSLKKSPLDPLATWNEGGIDWKDDPTKHDSEGSMIPGLEDRLASGLNGYIAFYKGKQIEVEAKTSFEAQQIATTKLKARRPHEVTVVLAEKEGKQVKHDPIFASIRNRLAAGSDDIKSRFEEGKPADPTKQMSPEDAAEWKKQNEEHKDEFKTAAFNLSNIQKYVLVKMYRADDRKGGSPLTRHFPWDIKKSKFQQRVVDTLVRMGYLKPGGVVAGWAVQLTDAGAAVAKDINEMDPSDPGALKAAGLNNDEFKTAAVNVQQLERQVTQILNGRFEIREGYSGRGMYGADSPFAITTSVRPNSPEGQKLQDLGLNYDNMGMDWIYYIHATGSSHYASLEQTWAETNAKIAARLATGLYGYHRAVQADCETCVRKLTREAGKVAKSIYAKDPETAPFLATHAKRASSLPAKILVAAMKDLGPKIASETKVAAGRQHGLYGFLAKTANLGVSACGQIRESAGHIAADLHHRKADQHEHLTGFLGSHAKEGRCMYSRLLHASYPDADRRLASAPGSVSDWLAWND